jgi:hypothetical protein
MVAKMPLPRTNSGLQALIKWHISGVAANAMQVRTVTVRLKMVAQAMGEDAPWAETLSLSMINAFYVFRRKSIFF